MCYQCDDPVPDEIPGDEDTVQRFATTFTETANALRDAARELANLANENISISLAVDEVRQKADDVRGDVGRVADRYEGAGSTYATYASSLGTARSTGNGARADIISNNDNARYWRHRQRGLREQAQWGGGDEELLEDLETAASNAGEYDANYITYLGRYNGAVENKDNAVTAALSGIQDAEEAADLNDGFWDGVLGDLQLLWEQISKHLGPIIEILRNVLEIIKKIVDVLALIVSIASIFIPALAPIAAALTAISAILAVAIFVCSAVLFLMGRESLGRVVADGISALTSVVTSRLGGGSLTSQIQTGWTRGSAALAQGTLFTGRNAAINAGVPLTKTYTDFVADWMQGGAIGGHVSAVTAPVNYLAQEGLDFRIDGQSGAWEPEGDPTSMLPGIFDAPTFGTVSPVAGLFDWDYDFASPADDIANWGPVTVSAS